MCGVWGHVGVVCGVCVWRWGVWGCVQGCVCVCVGVGVRCEGVQKVFFTGCF